MVENPVNVIRVYHGDDGESHFEDVDWPMETVVSGDYVRSAPRRAGETTFASQPPGFFYDWHPTPSRRFFVMISGSCEIAVSDGEARTFTRGDVLLLEDLEGPGHTMRVVGDQPRVAMHVLLKD